MLSGGTGKRHKPQSDDVLPKPFMKIKSSQAGESIMMIQKTWRVLADKFGPDRLFVVGNGNHESLLREHLDSDARLVLEPGGRDSFPAIALAASYLAAHGEAEPEDTIVALHADGQSDASFYDRIADLDFIVQNDIAPLGLIGVTPEYPAENDGYIVPMPTTAELAYRFVQRFHEQQDPPLETDLIGRGALRNAGVFAFRLRYLEEIVTRLRLPWAYSSLLEQYGMLPENSFEHMVVQPEKEAVCVAHLP